jgi:hypothetical protein
MTVRYSTGWSAIASTGLEKMFMCVEGGGEGGGRCWWRGGGGGGDQSFGGGSIWAWGIGYLFR